jgi:hypothetical protein
MNKETKVNNAINNNDYTFFNNDNLDCQNVNVDFNSVATAVTANSCFIISKLQEHTEFDFSFNKNHFINLSYVLLLAKQSEELHDHSEELHSYIIDRKNGKNIFCPKFIEKITFDNFRWKMIKTLWNDKNVRKTLEGDNKEVYDLLMKNEVEQKIKNFN